MEDKEALKNGSSFEAVTGMFSSVYRHPILSAAWVCLICMTMSSGTVSFAGTLIPALAIAALGVLASLSCYSRSTSDEGKRFSIIIAVSSVTAAALFCFLVHIRGSYAITVMDGGLAVTGAVFLVLAAKGRLNTRNIILLLFAAGFIMRFSYILYINADNIQHDVWNFHQVPSNGKIPSGHAGYIIYLYTNGHLPDFDVRNVDQFYHPPFHHILAALWVRIQTTLGMSFESSCENIQVLSLFYSTVSFILSYKIFRRLHLKDSGLILATAVIAFCPTFYFMAGAVNNDILSITFMLGAFYNTLCWYRSRRMSRILCIALCVGLGMFTKLSVWMVAPPIAVIFIYVFFNDLKNVKKYLLQFASFLCVCAPIGLFWSVRNLLRFQVPLTYIPKLSETSLQYIGSVPILSRLFSLDPIQFADVADQFTMYKGAYNEYNPLVALFKTSVFDEGIAVRNYPLINGFNHLLFWSAVLLGILGFGAMLYMLFRKKNSIDFPIRLSIGLFYALLLGMYYCFCFSYPHVCTMNIRYCTPIIVIGALSIGYLGYDLLRGKKTAQRISGYIICGAVGVYAFSGYLVYHAVATSYI